MIKLSHRGGGLITQKLTLPLGEVKKKAAFTLAEVLITLGIIGIVAAMTLPALISNYQKHVYYNQFRKAATILENALQLYAVHNGCEGDIKDCFPNSDRLGYYTENPGFVDKFVEYFSVSQKINSNNYADICKNYEIKRGYDTEELYASGFNCCDNDKRIPSTTHAFITSDGMLFNFSTDWGLAGASFVDVNGSTKGPNAYGRDVFLFYLDNNSKTGITWAGAEADSGFASKNAVCTGVDGEGCAAKLLRDGKMDY